MVVVAGAALELHSGGDPPEVNETYVPSPLHNPPWKKELSNQSWLGEVSGGVLQLCFDFLEAACRSLACFGG